MTTPHETKRAAFIIAGLGIIALIFGWWSTAHAFSSHAPAVVASSTPTVITVAPQPTPSTPGLILGDVGNTPNINTIVSASGCTSYAWPHRGALPRATVLGFAETYQKALCAKRPILTQAPDLATILVTDKHGTHKEAKSDVLAMYPSVSPTLPNLYALMLSSAAMESSGNVCEGRDTSAGPETSMQAESGMMQQSANLQALNPALVAIVAEYKAHPERCGFSTFRATACPTAGIVGSGPGADFQKLMLTCPALAIEQAALAHRVSVRHFGPARRGELTFVPACAQMFSDIAKPTTCN